VIENALALLSLRISIIVISIAFAGDMDMGDIADKLALACPDDGAEVPCF
jgi:hypothetical protein